MEKNEYGNVKKQEMTNNIFEIMILKPKSSIGVSITEHSKPKKSTHYKYEKPDCEPTSKHCR